MYGCLICKEDSVVESRSSGWYKCTRCEADSNGLVGGYLYPLFRRGTLCSQYTPVRGLSVERYGTGEVIEYLTSSGSRKSAKVIHVDLADNKMAIEDIDTQKRRLVVDNEVIADAYDDLFSSNKVEFAGWWNRRIEII